VTGVTGVDSFGNLMVWKWSSWTCRTVFYMGETNIIFGCHACHSRHKCCGSKSV